MRQHHADDELHGVLGHAGERRGHDEPGSGDGDDGGERGHRRERQLCWFVPNVRAMKTTSSPSWSTPLKEWVKAYQSAMPRFALVVAV
jgi:hypothetical protein